MSKRILLVDDDLDDQMLIRAAIEKVAPGDNCTVANNGKEALEYVETSSLYDIILIDLNMPLMNGFEALKKIKKLEQYKNIPVFILSASTDKYDIERCKRFGAASYLVKPHTFSALVDELKHILEKSESYQLIMEAMEIKNGVVEARGDSTG